MSDSFGRKFGLMFLLAALGAVTFFLLYNSVSPKASINLEYTRSEILERATRFMEQRGFNVAGLQQDAWFTYDGNTQLSFALKFGMDSANALMRENRVPAHHWFVNWYDAGLPTSQARETFELWMTAGGRVIGLKHNISDSAVGKSLTEEEARTLAEGFLAQQGFAQPDLELKSLSQTRQQNRLDYNFNWATIDSTVRRTAWVRIQGDEVGGYRERIDRGQYYDLESSQTATSATLFSTFSFAFMFLLSFSIIIFFLKKYHEGEVGIKTAMMVFVGLFVVNVVSTINVFHSVGSSAAMGDMNKQNVRWVVFGLNVLVVQVFLSVMAFAAWSVGESYSRSFWPQKLAGVDSALFRRFFTINVAEGLLRGFLIGLILLGLFTAAVFVLSRENLIGMFVLSASGVTDGFMPAAHPILVGLEAAIFSEIVFRLFFLSLFRDRFKRLWIGVIISTVIWCLAMFPMWSLPFGFFLLPVTVGVFFVFGLVFSFLFLKYDLLTTMTAHFVFVSLPAAVPLFTSSSPAFRMQEIAFFVMLAAPLVIAAIGFIRRERFDMSHEVIPEHIKRITERERMAKELEIARRVQMSLLPKSSPTAQGYDIAGTCIPAFEVGGDYYDFVNLGGKKIGIAIGDVSGKGVPAAIYMTLTKGILQSHAEENVSPKKVLSKVNSLMYRTIDRNSFVSMFYAILDMEERKIRFSRAGQCPVIVAQRGNQRGVFLTPKGMALGLEVGTVFDSVLEEQEVEIHSGDVLVFYTDGFTEAMNEKGEEFSEGRLVDSISRHQHKSATEIINSICHDVQSFTKGWQQHDDMTMVVVKVA